MTIFSVYPIENYNRGMEGNSNFARPMLPTYRGCTVLDILLQPPPRESRMLIGELSDLITHYCISK